MQPLKLRQVEQLSLPSLIGRINEVCQQLSKRQQELTRIQDRKKKTLIMWILQLFILNLSRADFQAFNFLPYSGTHIASCVEEMAIATLQDRNGMIS